MIEIPVTLFDGDTPALDDLGDPQPFRFFATAEGWMVDKKTLFGRFIVPTDKNPFAKSPEWSAKAYWDVPALPADLLARAWGFFRGAWEARKSEAMVYLLRKDDQYLLHIPRQRASIGGVHARLDPAELPDGASIVGSIHSHCNFSAFHSGTDQADAKKNDGLHITVGEVDKAPAQWAVMLSYSGFLWDLEMHHVTEADLETLQPIEPPAEWLARIDEPAKHTWTPGQHQQHRGVIPQRYSWVPSEHKNTVLWDDDDDFWESYWKARGYQPHGNAPEPPKDDYNIHFSLDSLIRSGALGKLGETDQDDLEAAEMALLEWTEYLMDNYGIQLDFEFSSIFTGHITTEPEKETTT